MSSGRGNVPVGICKILAEPVCGNTVGPPVLLCNVTNIDRNTRIEETAAIDIAGGTPGQKCFYLEQPNTRLPTEIVIDTCTGIAPEWEAITGRYNVKYYDPTDPTTATELPVDDPAAIGYLLTELKEDAASCLCACSQEGESCINRVRLTVWRRNYCYGSDGRLHPAGGYWIDHYPALEYTVTAQTQSATNSADAGSRYTFYAYTNAEAPVPVISTDDELGGTVDVPLLPGTLADGTNTGLADINGGCYFGFPTNICPPGDCSCGDCATGATGTVLGLTREVAEQVEGVVTPGELVGAGS